MPLLLLYLGLSVLIILFNALAAISLLRYRFKGDKSWFFIVLFAFLFAVDIGFTLTLWINLGPSLETSTEI